MTDEEMNSLWRDFGQFVARERRLQNLTQNDLAERVGLTRQHVQRIESGSPTKRETVEVIASELKIDTAEALVRAGFLPLELQQPKSVEEFLSALRALGIDLGIDVTKFGEFTEKDFERILDAVRLSILLRANASSDQANNLKSEDAQSRMEARQADR